jgi:hypothetical protein
VKLNVIGILFFLSIFFSCQKPNNPVYVEIPFRLENNRIIVDAIVNGRKGKFIFDTGSTESYVNTRTINLLPRAFTLTPYNGKRKIVLIYNLNKITFGDIELNTKMWLVKRSGIIKRTEQEGYDGVLGSRTFEGYWCELSFSKSKIILHKGNPVILPIFLR